MIFRLVLYLLIFINCSFFASAQETRWSGYGTIQLSKRLGLENPSVGGEVDYLVRAANIGLRLNGFADNSKKTFSDRRGYFGIDSELRFYFKKSYFGGFGYRVTRQLYDVDGKTGKGLTFFAGITKPEYEILYKYKRPDGTINRTSENGIESIYFFPSKKKVGFAFKQKFGVIRYKASDLELKTGLTVQSSFGVYFK